MFDGENFSSKMLNMRKISAISSTPALTTGGSLCASTTFLPLIVTSSRYTGLACCAASFLVCSFIVFSSSTDPDSFLQRRHDAGVSRTAADVSAQHLAQLLFGRFRIAREKIAERHQDSGRAEAALQRVMVLERLLQLVELAAVAGERFHRFHVAAFGLHRERKTGAHRRAVDLHRAAAADAVLAADVRPGRAEGMAQKIAEQGTRLGLGAHLAAVEREIDPDLLVFVYAAHCWASAMTSGARLRRMSRRNSAEACRSS